MSDGLTKKDIDDAAKPTKEDVLRQARRLDDDDLQWLAPKIFELGLKRALIAAAKEMDE